MAACAAASGHPDPGRLAPFTRARELETAVPSPGMAHQYPGHYREAASSWLARMLAGPDAALTRPGGLTGGATPTG